MMGIVCHDSAGQQLASFRDEGMEWGHDFLHLKYHRAGRFGPSVDWDIFRPGEPVHAVKRFA